MTDYQDAIRVAAGHRAVAALTEDPYLAAQSEALAGLLDRLAAAVDPDRLAPVSTFDLDAARKVLADAVEQLTAGLAPDWERVLEDLAGCVRPDPPQTIDRDALLNLLADALGQHRLDASVPVGTLTDRVLALLHPDPSQTIERDALSEQVWLLVDSVEEGMWTSYRVEDSIDRILALLHRLEGVVLTREECERAADWHDYIVDQGGEVPTGETDLALRLRAGAAS